MAVSWPASRSPLPPASPFLSPYFIFTLHFPSFFFFSSHLSLLLVGYPIWCEQNTLGLVFASTVSPSLSNWVGIIIYWGDFLSLYLFFLFFFLAVLAPSLCSSHLASIYPHLTRTDLFLNFICMTRYFPAPRNEERGWVCLLNLPTYPSDSVGISLYFLGRIHFSYPSRPAPSISYSCTFLPLHLSIIVAGFPSTCSRHIFN